jgi:hypothetical protein
MRQTMYPKPNFQKEIKTPVARELITCEAWLQHSLAVIGPCCSRILYSACDALSTCSPVLDSFPGRGHNLLTVVNMAPPCALHLQCNNP